MHQMIILQSNSGVCRSAYSISIIPMRQLVSCLNVVLEPKKETLLHLEHAMKR